MILKKQHAYEKQHNTHTKQSCLYAKQLHASTNQKQYADETIRSHYTTQHAWIIQNNLHDDETNIYIHMK